MARPKTVLPAEQVRKIKKLVQDHGRGGIAAASKEFNLSRFVINGIVGKVPVRRKQAVKGSAKRGRPAATSKATPAKVRRLEKLINSLFRQVGKLHKAVRALT